MSDTGGRREGWVGLGEWGLSEMIDGGGLAWKWTRKRVPASAWSRPAAAACEWPAGWPGPGRAPSAERVRGATSLWHAGVPGHTTRSTRALVAGLPVAMSLFDHRSSTVPSHPMCSFTMSQRREAIKNVSLPIETIIEGVWSRPCDERLRPIASAEARSASWVLGQSSGRSMACCQPTTSD